MKNYKQQIKEYKEEIEEKYVRAEAENKTVKACQNILSESVLSKQSHRTSYFEFLYEQTKFIKKRWWILQGCVLMCLWIWLSNYTSDIKDMMRIMGISATIFVVLIIPEIWKNRRNGAIEIEQASYYTLRQICTARMLMFGVVDLVIVMVFLAITYQTTILSLSDLVVNFLLPVNVSCCICFRVLYSSFRYASATAESYRIAADLIEAGADNGRINRVMFETKTKTYARLERLALESMRFYLDERVAIITVTQEMYHLTGSNEQETEGLAPLTRQIEGVEVGITIREKPDGTCKASLRTFESVNAAEIAKAFGGGGHPQAAACNLDMDVKTARAKLVEKCGELLV